MEAAQHDGLPHGELQGLRILIVEDAWMIAEMMREDLEGWGCTVAGPAARVEPGVQLARERPLDGALLDVNLGRDSCFPIADALAGRGIPFVFITGYSDAIIPPRFRGVPRLHKPYDTEVLASAMARHFLPAAAGAK